jgi:hypothetical protein
MKGILSQSKREYVLFHLNHHISLTQELATLITYSKQHNISGQIIFQCTENPFQIENVKWIDDLPVLFPIEHREDFFYFDDSGNLVFSHDILKTIFYLLSGYQEYENKDSRDLLNRFSYTDSIQYKLNITNKPVVNYLFQIIANAISQFCSRHCISFRPKRLFSNFGFLLTHDIDYVDLYTPNYIIYKLKEVSGLRKSKLSPLKNLQLAIAGMAKYLKIVKNDNPYWNFEFMLALEKKNNFRSVFYFLDQGVKHSDSYYSFFEDRMIRLFERISSAGAEIGLHGPVKSVDQHDKMKSSFRKLQQASKVPITGIRQHRLLWKHPLTASIQADAGLKYDTTLGFAACEGFRNSYCLPFKLYDFEKDNIINLWEFPMTAMDVTLFGYRKLSPEEAMRSCLTIISEIQKFGGIFTLLWHNSFFDEQTYPGVTEFYKSLLDKIAALKPESILGSELLDKIDKLTLTTEHE